MRLITIAALLAAFAASFADEPKNMTFDTQLKTVAIFKDGFGYYVREGKVKLENGWCTAKSIPTAVRGTIWVYPGDAGDSIDTLYSVKSNVLDVHGADEIKKNLANKIGLDITVDAANRQFSGKVSRLLDDMLMLDIGGAFTAIPYGSISKLTLPGYPLRIKMKTDKPDKVTTVGMAYVQEGARWEPSYVLELKGLAPGKLTLRANILALPESVKDTNMLFVVGSPQLSNRGQGETFVPVNQQPADAAEALKVPVVEKDKQQLKPEMEGGDAPVISAAPAAPPVAGDSSGELYYYTKPSFTMDKGDVAMVTIFEHTVPIKPSFEWLADGDELNYILKIENKSGQPFTDGPVFVVEDGKPVGQETIKYCPSGATADLRLSRGVGLRTERTDVEVSRGGVMTVGKTQFLPIRMKGTLKVTSFRKTDSQIKITRTVRGKVTSVSKDGAVKDTQVFTGDPNAVYRLEWNVVVPAEGTATVEYDYETYTAIAKLGGPPVPGGDEFGG